MAVVWLSYPLPFKDSQSLQEVAWWMRPPLILPEGDLALKRERTLYLLSDLNLVFGGVSVSRWTKAHDLLCQQKIQKFQIAQVVRESNAMLR